MHDVLECLQGTMQYDVSNNTYHVKYGKKGYGKSVLYRKRGEVTFALPHVQVLELITEALAKGEQTRTFKVDIEDRLGSPGYPEYWPTHANIKRYTGPVNVSLTLNNGEAGLKFELSDHDKHPWSGWVNTYTRKV